MAELTPTALASMSTDAVERLYRETPAMAAPRGVFRGVHLHRLGTRGARRLRFRAIEGFAFQLIPFGIDFEQRAWFFADPRITMGRFDARIGPSRWRPTDALCLRYDPSRLPQSVMRLLYDEVKPLSDSLCLGLGGVNAGRGDGDHFFFALERT
jgi:hypothetical protein